MPAGRTPRRDGQRVGLQVRDVLAIVQDDTLERGDDSNQRFDQGALASAIRPYDRRDLPAPHPEAHAGDDSRAAVPPGEVLHLEVMRWPRGLSR